MTENDKKLMDRYIYQVVRRLPKDSGIEISRELEELITDMLEKADSMEDVLTQLGDPKEFAKKYQDYEHYLIGPQNYDIYIWFAKIVLICTAVSVLIVSLIIGIRDGIFMESDTYIISGLTQCIINATTNATVNAITSCIMVFGVITLIFAIIDKQRIKINLKNEKKWSVGEMTPIPDKKSVINKSDCIISIVFTVFMCVILIFLPNFFSVCFDIEGEIISVPFFNLDKWNIILPFFILSMIIGLADEILQLVIGIYCKAVMISNIIAGILQIVLMVIVLKILPFWNPNFISKIKEIKEITKDMPEKGAVISFMDFILDIDINFTLLSNIFLAGIIGITVLEMINIIYKSLKYGTDIKQQI